jgi:hypothetical protein
MYQGRELSPLLANPYFHPTSRCRKNGTSRLSAHCTVSKGLPSILQIEKADGSHAVFDRPTPGEQRIQDPPCKRMTQCYSPKCR